MRERVLIVDDDDSLRAAIETLLVRSGFEVIPASGGEAGLRALYKDHPDLILLDITMLGIDGWAVLERIRGMTEIPVIVVSGLRGELEKVRALNAGADDYVTKPFGNQELIARIRAALRRGGGSEPDDDVYEDGLLRLDFENAEVVAAGNMVKLTPIELRLLAAFVHNPSQVLSRDQLLELVWGEEDLPPGRVKLYVGYLRRKFRAQAGTELPIETVRGFGYRYRAP
jgi:DNA-binding response OmpR family regulator